MITEVYCVSAFPRVTGSAKWLKIRERMAAATSERHNVIFGEWPWRATSLAFLTACPNQGVPICFGVASNGVNFTDSAEIPVCIRNRYLSFLFNSFLTTISLQPAVNVNGSLGLRVSPQGVAPMNIPFRRNEEHNAPKAPLVDDAAEPASRRSACNLGEGR